MRPGELALARPHLARDRRRRGRAGTRRGGAQLVRRPAAARARRIDPAKAHASGGPSALTHRRDRAPPPFFRAEASSAGCCEGGRATRLRGGGAAAPSGRPCGLGGGVAAFASAAAAHRPRRQAPRARTSEGTHRARALAACSRREQGLLALGDAHGVRAVAPGAADAWSLLARRRRAAAAAPPVCAGRARRSPGGGGGRLARHRGPKSRGGEALQTQPPRRGEVSAASAAAKAASRSPSPGGRRSLAARPSWGRALERASPGFGAIAAATLSPARGCAATSGGRGASSSARARGKDPHLT